jgi:putative transposase
MLQKFFINETTALYPLHKVDVEYAQLDIYVTSNKTGDTNTLGRPWISFGIDEFSTAIWAIDVSLESPSVNTVRRLLYHGVFDKNVKKNYGAKNEWEVHGIPSQIMLYNTPGFRSIEMKKLITDILKSEIKYRPQRVNGNEKIERILATINAMFINNQIRISKINQSQIRELNLVENTMPTLQDITRLLTVYITDIYHFQPQLNLPVNSNIPIIRYREGLIKTIAPRFIAEGNKADYEAELLGMEDKK